MNKYELAKKITQLEGLTNEEKASLVELLRSQKKYGLVWEDKQEEIETRLVDELPVLTEVPERAIVSESPDAPNHILIEGDNLEALTALAYTHEGKIDVIYIDPPYNTGNKDFVYNDSFVDREDGYRHSKWLSFMNKRLQIAKSLLSSGGVIFISIDENEEAQLKLLCDTLFGNNNYIGTLTWESTTQPINAGKAKFQLQQKTEWILAYTNNKSLKPNFILKEKESKTKKYPFKGKLGLCRLEIIEKSDAGQYNRETMKFPILGHYPRQGKRWQIGEETANFLIENNRIEIEDGIVKKAIYPEDEKDSIKYIPFWSFFSANEVGSALKGKEELNNIMGYDVGFDTVKPSKLIKELILHFNNDSTILDFFAGSGTTLHAIMQLNHEDGGRRKCILVNNNENSICEKITYGRNKRVINGYTSSEDKNVEGLHDNNLRYYRTTFLSRDKSVKNMRQLVRLATDMLCIKNDVYTEAEFCGKKINPNIARYFDNGQGNRMLVIYEERAIQLLVQLMAQTEDDGIKTMVYVFSPGADPYTDDFEDIAERVKLCALPSAIYEAYKRVLPKRKPKFLDEALQEMKAQAEAEANAQQTLDFGENDNMNEEGGEA